MGNSSALKRGTMRTQFASRGQGNGSGFGAKADHRSGELVVGLAGDSTGDETAEWFSRGFDLWLATHPWVTCIYNIWNDATGSYTTSTKQTSNVPASTVFNDTFNRTASDLYGTTPDTGQPWTGGGTAPNSWSINGTKAVALASSTGVLQAVHGVAGDTTVTLTGVTINSATMRGTLNLFGKQINANTQVYLYVGIDSSGNSSMGIWKNINGVSAGVVFGGSAPLPASSTTTFNMSMTIAGTAVSGTVNGVTINGTLSGLEAQLLSPSTQAAFQATPATMAGMTVDQFAVTAQPGMQNLRLYNGSKAGSKLDYQALRLGKMYPEPMDMLFVSSAHNYTTDDANSYPAKVQQFVENFRNLRPESGIVLVAQNPEFPPSSGHQLHNQRIMSLRMLAAEYGYGYLPAAEEFKSLPDGGKSLIRSDGVHPNGSVEVADPNNGSYLWATVAKRYLDSLVSPLARSAANFAPRVGVSSPAPQVGTSQGVSGRSVVGIFNAGSTLIGYNNFGLAQSDNAGATWAGKNLPSDAQTTAANAGKVWIVLFKGNYYMQVLKISDGLPGIFSAAPVAGGGSFTWSASLLNGSTGSAIISTGLATDGNYLYWCEYGDPVSGPSVWRSPDGTTWTRVLGPGTFAARHCHGIYPDPYNPGTVYLSCGDAGSAGYFYRSTDSGATWSVLPGNAGTNQSWQSVQMSFDADWIYCAPDNTSNMSVWKMDRATLTPRWHARQAHRHLPVPQGISPRRVTDLNTTSGSATITSATAAFTSADVGSKIRTTGQNFVPIDAYIASVASSTQAALYSNKLATATTTAGTAIFGGEAWGAMAYYGAVDPATGIYYFVSINGASGGNVDGLFAVFPDGSITLLDILNTSPDAQVVIANGLVYVQGFSRPLLAL